MPSLTGKVHSEKYTLQFKAPDLGRALFVFTTWLEERLIASVARRTFAP